MASTYSPNLRLELIGTGDQQGTWGATTNTNLGTLLEEAIGGYVSVTVTDGADTTLTTNNGTADQSRNMIINLAGALTAARNVICPAIEKLYVVRNATTGGYAVTFKVSGQTGVSIPNGATYVLYVNGTDAVAVTGTMANQLATSVAITGGSISGITDLAVADGGTGASTAANARTNLGLGTVSTQNANAVAITGGSIIANASSLSILDSDASNIMTLAVGSNLTANTTLTLTTGSSSNRTLDISAANVTISTAGAALIDDADASAQRTTLGLGSISTQNANAVSITGGSVTGITDLAVADGGTGASDAATARTNLGLGSISTQNANAVTITGGTIVANASGISIRDADASNVMTIAVGSNLTANTTLTLTTGASSSRTLDISAANVTISTAGAALIDDADNSAQRTTLGLGTIATQNSNAVSITGGSIAGITDLAVADGGTGASSFTAYSVILGGTTSTGALQNVSGVGTSGQVLKSGGSGASPSWGGVTSIDSVQNISATGNSFTGIPSTARQIIISIRGLQAPGSFAVQVGTSGGFVTSGYDSAGFNLRTSQSANVVGAGGYFIVAGISKSYPINGSITLTNMGGNVWSSTHVMGTNAGANTGVCYHGGGAISLSNALDRVQVVPTFSTFDATGTINILYF